MSGRRLLILALGLWGCSSNGGSGGNDASSGAASVGASSGNSAGSTSGGQSATGGSSAGAPANGGQASGGANSGGAEAAGTASVNGGTGAGGTGASSSGGAGTAGASSSGGAAGVGAGGASTGTWWKPAKSTTFYWDLQNTPPDNTENVGAYDIDGWGNSADEVAALHAKGIKVVCYMDAGTYEPGRPDSADFPASLQGAKVDGWPGELWLDVRPSGPNYAALQAIMLARFKVCQQKGFDAVEPDNIDSYQNQPGFSTSAADQLTYDEWLATTVHGLGLAIFQKNDLDQVGTLESHFDGILDEECNKYSECDTLAPYTSANKPAWDAEYQEDGETTAKFCTADVQANIVGALFALALDGSLFQPCSNDVGPTN
jgi:hypothetical protein